ncbi:hypothetical protein H8E88_11020 [candidate division KSB1 bacterium]|nr:hypothetical protein [candidate division KSB1 bacterium]
MINFKQKELIKILVQNIQKKFPEVKFLNVNPSPENPNDLWVEVTAPENEDREIELLEYSADKSMDILLDYGYHIFIMPTPNSSNSSQQQDMEISLAEN